MVNNTNSDNYGLVITLPAILDETELARLRELIAGKATLLTRALGADRLDITTSDDGVSFPWWDELPEVENITAYSKFLSKLLAYAKRIRHTTSRSASVDVVNEKYVMRALLYRLGLSGPEYRQVRTILLAPLSGNSAWKEPKK